ncbi:hypothetical protein R6Q59_013691 [Mikania micrantha]
MPGEGTSNAAQGYELNEAVRHQLQPNFVPRSEFHTWSPVAYQLKRPQELRGVHDTFHVSNLKKCLSNEALHIPLEEVCLDEKLHLIEVRIEIMDREIKKLNQSHIPIVKVRWNSRRGPEFTWEREDHVKQKYPHLFNKSSPFNDK